MSQSFDLENAIDEATQKAIAEIEQTERTLADLLDDLAGEEVMNNFYCFYNWLENKGYNIDFIGGQCPYQIKAIHKDGHSIYFRARGNIAELSFYENDRAIHSDRWEFTKKPDAGYIDQEAFPLFYGMYWDAMGRLA